MREQDPQSPDAIEEQIEETRHHLSDTLEELQRRLSPQDIFSETVNYLKSNKGLGRSINTTVREHPVPIGLIGLGVTWLIASSASGDQSRHGISHSEASSSYGTTSTGESQSKQKARQKMSDAKSKASEATAAAKDKLQDAKSSLSGATEQRHQQGGHMQESYQNARNQGSKLARNLRQNYQQRGEQMRHRANSIIEERPLAVVAIGFGIGAALGLMLPSTERENRLLGDTRDDLKHRALEEGQEQFERAREKVESAAEATRKQVEEQSRAASKEAANSGSSGGKPRTESAPQASSPTPSSAPSSTQSPGSEPMGDSRSKNQSPPGKRS